MRVWLRKAKMNVPLNQIITKNMKVCSCFQQPYVRTTRKDFACRVDRAVIRMKDSVFVLPSVNSRPIIPCRIIRTRLRSLNTASFPFIYCHSSTCSVFPSPIHICSLCVCVCVFCRMKLLRLIFLFLLGYLYSFFSLFYFHVQLLHAMVRQRWLYAWYSCFYVLFTNYNSRTIWEIRLTREAAIAWLSILLQMLSFLNIRCCRILSNLLLSLLLLQRQ